MASTGKKLDDEDLYSYVLAALDFEYNSLVSSIVARVELISFSKLYAQLLAFEIRLELQGSGHSQSSANYASCGQGGYKRGRGGHPRGSPCNVGSSGGSSFQGSWGRCG
jgi:hypothetical protein